MRFHPQDLQEEAETAGMHVHREKAKERALPRNPPCWHLNLGLPAPRTVRNRCLLVKPPVCGLLLWWPEQTTSNTPCLPRQMALFSCDNTGGGVGRGYTSQNPLHSVSKNPDFSARTHTGWTTVLPPLDSLKFTAT